MHHFAIPGKGHLPGFLRNYQHQTISNLRHADGSSVPKAVLGRDDFDPAMKVFHELRLDF